MKDRIQYFWITAFLFSLLAHPIQAVEAVEQDKVNVNATVIIASNEGDDFDLDNDDFRDRLIELFSYSAYRQVDVKSLDLVRGDRVKMTLPDEYELILTLQGEEEGRLLVQAVIRKGMTQLVDTILSILTPGVAFIGGPPINGGTLIIVLENGF